MKTLSSSRLTFKPRPEADAKRWSELLSPTKRAVSELLNRLRGGVEAAAKPHTSEGNEDHIATTLLINGERGTGKTTVLLCAKQATEKFDDFFRRDKAPGGGANAQYESTKEDARSVKNNVVWLDPLDLEAVFGKSNLLTTVLVCIQAELDKPRDKRDSPRRTASLLEGESEDAVEQLESLIRDATLIWEDIEEQHTREKANQQIRTAQVYASFQSRFRKAMACVAKRLSRLHGDGAEKVLVLPIDNIDRSAAHVQGIFKLAQMISSHHLWLVLAGDRIDVNVFLERAYREELALDGQSGLRDDEERLIARRQAAATNRKVIAPLQRIEVELVQPDEALAFTLDGARTIRQLLEAITLPPLVEDGDDSARALGPPRTLLDLFDLGDRIRIREPQKTEVATVVATHPVGRRSQELLAVGVAWEEEVASGPLLSTAGRLALRAPARTLVDLWLCLCDAALRDPGDPDTVESKGSDAVRIVRTLLRLALNESDLPDWVVKKLQDHIIRRDIENDTRLHLDGVELRVKPAMKASLRKEFGATWGENGRMAPGSLRSWMQAYERHAPSLSIVFEDTPDGKKGSTDLPPLVAGWLICLYDILMFAREPWILGDRMVSKGKCITLLETTHTILLQSVGRVAVRLCWEMPQFVTFFDADVFCEQWKRFMAHVKKWGRLGEKWEEKNKERMQLLAAAWVDCANSVMDREHGGWDPFQAGFIDDLLSNYRQYRERVIERSVAIHKDIEGRYPDTCRVADAVRRWIQGGIVMPLLPEISGLAPWTSGEKWCSGVAERLFDELDLSRQAKMEIGWDRFERMRNALEQGLGEARASREDPVPFTATSPLSKEKIFVRPVGGGPLKRDPLDLRYAASALTAWLLREFFRTGEGDIDGFAMGEAEGLDQPGLQAHAQGHP